MRQHKVGMVCGIEYEVGDNIMIEPDQIVIDVYSANYLIDMYCNFFITNLDTIWFPLF